MNKTKLNEDLEYFLLKRKYALPGRYQEIETRLLETLSQDMRNYSELQEEIKENLEQLSLQMYYKGVREGANMVILLLSL